MRLNRVDIESNSHGGYFFVSDNWWHLYGYYFRLLFSARKVSNRFPITKFQ